MNVQVITGNLITSNSLLNVTELINDAALRCPKVRRQLESGYNWKEAFIKIFTKLVKMYYKYEYEYIDISYVQ